MIQVSAAAGADKSDRLEACFFCGFQDSGAFCSQCGGRYSTKLSQDLSNCYLPAGYMAQLKAMAESESYSNYGSDTASAALMACENFNTEMGELERALKYGDPTIENWRFARPQVARMIESLPQDVPNRDDIAYRLWRVSSEVEFEIEDKQLRSLDRLLEFALDEGDLKKCDKYFAELSRFELTRAPERAAKAKEKFAGRIEKLRNELAMATAAREYEKLRMKAEKLMFQREQKKAAKAIQECQFWLSKNEHRDKAALIAQLDQWVGAVSGQA